MNSKSILALIMVILVQSADKVTAEIPLFRKSFKKEDIVTDNEFNGTRFLKIATNGNLEDLKKILMKTMGKEWVEIPDKIDFGPKNKLDVPGGKLKPPKILGTARFTNEKHPGIHIHLVVMQIPIKNKVHTCLITTMKKR